MINFYEKKINGVELQVVNYGADNALFIVGTGCQEYSDYSVIFEDLEKLVRIGNSTPAGAYVGTFEEYRFNDKNHWIEILRDSDKDYLVTTGIYPATANRKDGISYTYKMPAEDFFDLIGFFEEFVNRYSNSLS